MTEIAGQSLNQASGRAAWVVMGGSGFVGQGVVEAVEQEGTREARACNAPRVLLDPNSSAADVLSALDSEPALASVVHDLAATLVGTDVVINAAGLATPDAKASPEMTGANALLPVLIAQAASKARVRRLVHLSSAAVQGRRKRLDESAATAPFSAYSTSKALGEDALRLWKSAQVQSAGNNDAATEIVVVRATSVQGEGRGTSNGLVRVASSPLSSVASPGTQPSVVSSLKGLSSFIVRVSAYSGAVPSILLQPWEGASVTDVLTLAGGGRRPKVIPAGVAKLGTASLNAASRLVPSLTGMVRRLEVMWFGQDQVVGWGYVNGLVPEAITLDADAMSGTTELGLTRGPSEALRAALNAPSGWRSIDFPEGSNS
jgi:hypothetical protein